jgi:predicted cupin superfamily sugar epimerase
MLSAERIIQLLQLERHPVEGGFFRETYRSQREIPRGMLPDNYGDSRSVSTAIYYLLTPDTFSAIHRLPGDEVFHFYLGDPVEMLQLRDGQSQRLVIGTDLVAGMQPQVVVPFGTWQGSRLIPGGRFALLGATMAPGFDYADYEPGERPWLMAEFPEQGDLIACLTVN